MHKQCGNRFRSCGWSEDEKRRDEKLLPRMVHQLGVTFELSRTLQIAMLVTAWVVSMISRTAVM